MKKLLSSLLLLILVMAFAGTASATTLLYKENFSLVYGTANSANWSGLNNCNVTINAAYPNALYLTNTSNLPATYAIAMLSNFSLSLVAGETYEVYVKAVGIGTANELGLLIYNGNNGDTLGKTPQFELVNAWNAQGDPAQNASLVKYTFTATADAANNIGFMFVGTNPSSFVISGFEVYGEPGPVVPIPGAIFLIAPGIAGLAAMKRRMK